MNVKKPSPRLQLFWRLALLTVLGAAAGLAAITVDNTLLADEGTGTRAIAAVAAGSLATVILGVPALAALAHWREKQLRNTRDRLNKALMKLHHRGAFEDELDQALAMAETEQEVVDTIKRALDRIDPQRPVELHVLDPNRPVLTLAFSTFDNDIRPAPASPWDSVAASTGKTVSYETTQQLDCCPHLASRIAKPSSAVCVPLTAMGRILGVLYALGPEGSTPTPAALEALTMIANRAAAHIAIVRAFAEEEPTPVDPLTGLPNAHSMHGHLRGLIESFTPFSIAIGDIDELDAYNERHGRPVGDDAVVLMSKSFAEAIRPEDHLGRLTAEEFLAVFPNTATRSAARAVERVRETLTLTLTDTDVPAFTATFGVSDSNSGDSIDEIIERAREALHIAKAEGCNRVVVADDAELDITGEIDDPLD